MTYGDVPKWLKGPDSKSGRSALPAQGFKSLHLRSINSSYRCNPLDLFVRNKEGIAESSVQMISRYPLFCFIPKGSSSFFRPSDFLIPPRTLHRIQCILNEPHHLPDRAEVYRLVLITPGNPSLPAAVLAMLYTHDK